MLKPAYIEQTILALLSSSQITVPGFLLLPWWWSRGTNDVFPEIKTKKIQGKTRARRESASRVLYVLRYLYLDKQAEDICVCRERGK